MRTPKWHQQRNSVFPMPTVVMSGLALLAALILAFARATLTAKGHLHIAARLDAHVHTAMFLGGVGMFTAISIAIARLVGARVLEYGADRRRVAETLSGRSIASKHHALPPGKQLSVVSHRAVRTMGIERPHGIGSLPLAFFNYSQHHRPSDHPQKPGAHLRLRRPPISIHLSTFQVLEGV